VVVASLALPARVAGVPLTPDSFTVIAPPAMTMEAGQEAMLALHFKGNRFESAVSVTFPDLPAGITITPVGPGRSDQKSWRGVVRAAPGTPAHTAQITVQARAGGLGKEATFPLTITRPTSSTAVSQVSFAPKTTVGPSGTQPQTPNLPEPERLARLGDPVTAIPQAGTLAGGSGSVLPSDPDSAIRIEIPPTTERAILNSPVADNTLEGDKTVPEPIVLTAPFAPAPTPAPTPKEVAAAPPSDRYALMKALQGTALGDSLDGLRLRLSGWADVSYTASSVAHNQLPMGFNYLANNFLLQQNWIRFERTVVTSGTTEPTFGFRTDWILPGADYRFTAARGLFSGQLVANNGHPIIYGIDPIDFYVEGYFPTVGRGLDVKVGRFFAQVGVEANDAPSNALFSHAYTFIYNPFTHTGFMATLKLTDAWTVYGGLVLGSDVFIDPAAEPTFMGGVKWAPPQGPDTLAVNVMLCDGRFNVAEQFYNPNLVELIWTHRFNPRLTSTLHAAYAYQTNVPDLGFIWSLGVVNYLTYDFTPRLSGTTRLEFYDDAQGQRTGFSGLYTALTAGLTFKPYRFLTIRPELRYDYNPDSRPFQNNHGLFTASTDVIVRW